MADGQLAGVLHYVRRLTGAHADDIITDRVLLARFLQRRDEPAFAALVERHGAMVLGVCRRILRDRHEAEDAFQAAFLVLARKGRSIRSEESLAGWLGRVAYHIAVAARAAAARRKARERRAAEMTATPSPPDDDLHELRAILDEELHRLPAKYHAPMVLCYLEGKTNEEAARLLRWPSGTVKGRLARARDLLRTRLARRGVSFPASALVALLALEEGAAVVPADLIAPTVTAAMGAGGASAPAVGLAEAALRQMATLKLRLAAVVTLALALLGAAAGVATHGTAATPAAPPPAEPAKPKRAEHEGVRLPDGALARIGTARWRHHRPLTAVVFSPDGKYLAGGDAEAFGRIWDASTGDELLQFQGKPVGFSPDGKIFVSRGEKDAVEFRELPTGKIVRKVRWGPDGFLFFTGGKTLVGAHGRTISVLDIETDRELHSFAVPKTEPIYRAALAPDGKSLAWASGLAVIRLWDLETGKQIREFLLRPHDRAQTLAFSPDGKTLAYESNGLPRLLHVLDVATGRELARFNGTGEVGFWPYAYAPDGKTLAVRDAQQRLCIWDPTANKVLQRLACPPAHVTFRPDGKGLLLWGTDNALHPWDLATGKEVARPPGHVFPITAVALSPEGKLLASTSQRGPLRVWDVATGKEVRRPPGHLYGALTAAYHWEGKPPAQTTVGRVRPFWEVAPAKERLLRIEGKWAFPLRLALSADGKILTGALADQTMRAWRADTGAELRSTKFPWGYNLRPLAFSPDGRLLIVADSVAGLWLWQTDTAAAQRLRGSGGAVTTASLRQLKGHTQAATAAAFSADGLFVATASYDGTVRFWEVETGLEICRLTGQEGAVAAVAVSSHAGLLASGGKDQTVRLWDPGTGREVRRLTGHRGGVTSVFFAGDGKTLASGSEDTTALVWDVRGVGSGRPPVPETAAAWDTLWADLAAAGGVKVYRAVTALASAPPGRAVAFLQDRLRPVTRDEALIKRLIADLDSKEFKVRDRAMQKLFELSEVSFPVVRKALAGELSLETRRRLEALLAKVPGMPLANERLWVLRGVAVLKRLGTPEARRVLEALAGGVREVRETEAARAALAFLSGRP
jgi:RNA polymerase sigma factor (sigma-70 family)